MGVNHNIIHLFRQDGLSQQQAYDRVNDLLHARYRAWYLSHSQLPSCGEPVDVQVQMYVKGCRDVVLGNLNWRYVDVVFLATALNCFLSDDREAVFRGAGRLN